MVYIVCTAFVLDARHNAGLSPTERLAAIMAQPGSSDLLTNTNLATCTFPPDHFGKILPVLDNMTLCLLQKMLTSSNKRCDMPPRWSSSYHRLRIGLPFPRHRGNMAFWGRQLW